MSENSQALFYTIDLLILVRVERLELSFLGWKPSVLPLDDTRIGENTGNRTQTFRITTCYAEPTTLYPP